MIYYYDETFHDRKFTMNEKGFFNPYSTNSNETFIYGLIGQSDDAITLFLNDYVILETKIKDSLQLTDELKSTTFAHKNFRFGFKSLKNQCKDFYVIFIELLEKHNVDFQIGMFSKTEMLLSQVISKLKIHPLINIEPKSFLYSIVKFIDHHRMDYLLFEILNQENLNYSAFIKKLIYLMKRILLNIKRLKREEREAEAIRQMIFILETSKCVTDGQIDLSMDYGVISGAISKKYKKDSDVKIVVDNEESTYQAITSEGWSASQEDSKLSSGLRAVDMFIGLIGRTMTALRADLTEPYLKKISDIKTTIYAKKRLLPVEWFDIDEGTFNLYQRMAKFLTKTNSEYDFITQIYCDNCVLLTSFFEYFLTIDSYKTFISLKEMHPERLIHLLAVSYKCTTIPSHLTC